MKSSSKVTDQLQKLLAYELASIHQYFLHSEIYDDMGLKGLFERILHEMQEEQEHAQLLMRRMLFLETRPDVVTMAPLMIGADVEEMIKNDLQMEYKGREIIIESIAVCEEESDYESREIFEKLLYDTEEDHIRWLEQQVRLIGLMGIENYCQNQMDGGEAPE